MNFEILSDYLQLNTLTIIMSAFVLLISLIIQLFSSNYLRGDRKQLEFFLALNTLSISIVVAILSAHIWLFFVFWIISNLLLVKLMVHEDSWKQARKSGLLTMKYFSFGFLALFIATATLNLKFGINTFDEIIDLQYSKHFGIIQALIFILIFITAAIQSAQVPFGKWLESSLNSPTPVSAFMHAGLVNGGAIILLKYYPLITENINLFNFIFIVGSISAIYGSLVMMLQSKIKNKLACSTIGQMGFMFMEIGAGLVPAALGHLMMHGFFKGFLFLSSGAAAQKIKISKEENQPLLSFILALILGFASSIVFIYFSHLPFDFEDTRSLIVLFIFMSFTQFAYSFFKASHSFIVKLISIPVAIFTALAYGLFVHKFELMGHLLDLNYIVKINSLHYLVLALFVIAWLINVAISSRLKFYRLLPQEFLDACYVKLINISKPESSTVTSLRQEYNYK